MGKISPLAVARVDADQGNAGNQTRDIPLSESADEKRYFAFSDAAEKRRELSKQTKNRIGVLRVIGNNGMEFRNRNNIPFRMNEVTGIGVQYGSVIRR